MKLYETQKQANAPEDGINLEQKTSKRKREQISWNGKKVRALLP